MKADVVVIRVLESREHVSTLSFIENMRKSPRPYRVVKIFPHIELNSERLGDTRITYSRSRSTYGKRLQKL